MGAFPLCVESRRLQQPAGWWRSVRFTSPGMWCSSPRSAEFPERSLLPSLSLLGCPTWSCPPLASKGCALLRIIEESEDLERQNAALRREIKQLTEEMKHFTSVLSSHEPLCSILASPPPPPPEVLYAAHSFHQPHISSPRFQH
uniref:Basic leucine zipper ATF-like transcription factor n=1 Tax=Coturnix japonica TaxID=93934 RepID=A0A8C2UCF9_COTJA